MNQTISKSNRRANEQKFQWFILRTALIFLIVGFLLSCSIKKAGKKVEMIKIIPKPFITENQEGFFAINGQTKIIIDQTNPEMIWLADYFNQIISYASNFQLKVVSEGEGSGEIKFNLTNPSADLEEEGYHLSVKSRSIEIKAKTPAGLFYGLQSLRQSFPVQLEDSTSQNQAWHIPCVEIKDKPRFPWRGEMLDVSRHFLPLDLIHKNIDYMARYKMNTFHWHLTDDQGWRLEIKNYPKLTEIGAWRVDRNEEPWWGRDPAQPGELPPMADIIVRKRSEISSNMPRRDLLRSSRKLTCPDIPRQPLPPIRKYPVMEGPTVATGGVASGNTYCPGKEVTFEFIDNMLEEVFEMFPGEFFHVGGDECHKDAWKVCPDCQQRMVDEGLKDEHELRELFYTTCGKISERTGKEINWLG